MSGPKIVTQNGVVIWLARRRDKGRPAEAWERVWKAVVWGQPLALIISPLLSLRMGEDWLIAIYLLVTMGSVGGPMQPAPTGS